MLKVFEAIKKKNPLQNTLLMSERHFDCKGFDSNEDHPLHGHAFLFPSGLVEIGGVGTLVSEISQVDKASDTIDKTLYFFNPDEVECEVVLASGDVKDFQLVFNATMFSKYQLRQLGIEKIIIKEAL